MDIRFWTYVIDYRCGQHIHGGGGRAFPGRRWQRAVCACIKYPLVSGKEYCLTLILTDDGTQQYYYYTRILYGEDYRLSDKLQFVWDFNQNTMDPDMSAVIKNYLETSGLNDNTSFTNIDIYSSAMR